jgi:hypothetical protein
MSTGDPQLRALDGTGHGGIHVAGNDDEIGFLLQADLLESDHHLGGLLGMGSRTDAEVDVGPRQVEVGEENVGHRGVVMLPRVDELLIREANSLDGVDERGNLHEIWTRPDDVKDLLSQ